MSDTATDSRDAMTMTVDPVLPEFDSATTTNVRRLISLGQAAGNRLDVVAKIGDSITESASFLFDCGFGWFNLGPHASLEPTILYWSERMVDPERNSLNRSSFCAVAGWTTLDALTPQVAGGMTPIEMELAAIQPQFAIVMYGTNDMDRYELPMYRSNLNALLEIIEMNGTVPAVSTIPDRSDGSPSVALVPVFNDAIRAIARERHLPLIDLNVALSTLPDHGVSADHIHPNTFDSSACDFSDMGLQFGYNVRNYTALQMLQRLRAMTP